LSVKISVSLNNTAKRVAMAELLVHKKPVKKSTKNLKRLRLCA
jgi:hypothetical protein